MSLAGLQAWSGGLASLLAIRDVFVIRWFVVCSERSFGQGFLDTFNLLVIGYKPFGKKMLPILVTVTP